jgi:PAS domain S-box-containing protein
LVSIFRYENKQLELDFLKYKNVRFQQEYKFIYQDINEQLTKLKKIIEVLKNGGVYQYRLEENNQKTETISYKSTFNCQCYHINQLEPILKEISIINTQIGDILINTKEKNNSKFNQLIKRSEASFNRILEIIDTVSFQMHKKLEKQEREELREFYNFKLYKSIFVFFIIAIALFFSYKVYQNIRKVTKLLDKEIIENNIFTQVIKQSPISIVITDTNGNIEFVNEFFTKQTGYTKEEAMGKNPKILKSGILPDAFYTNLWETINSGKVWKGEFCNQTKNGVIYWEHAIISPLFDEKGDIVKYIAVKDNITEKKKLKNSLRESSQVLETVMIIYP